MDNVQVGHDALLPHGQGLGAPFGCLNNARSVSVVRQVARSKLISQIWNLLGRYGCP